jgi:hypothetical protein
MLDVSSAKIDVVELGAGGFHDPVFFLTSYWINPVRFHGPSCVNACGTRSPSSLASASAW